MNVFCYIRLQCFVRNPNCKQILSCSVYLIWHCMKIQKFISQLGPMWQRFYKSLLKHSRIQRKTTYLLSFSVFTGFTKLIVFAKVMSRIGAALWCPIMEPMLQFSSSLQPSPFSAHWFLCCYIGGVVQNIPCVASSKDLVKALLWKHSGLSPHKPSYSATQAWNQYLMFVFSLSPPEL